MLFGRVRGTAICTIKYPGTEGVKLLVVTGVVVLAAPWAGGTLMRFTENIFAAIFQT